jgi:hypothetical protein
VIGMTTVFLIATAVFIALASRPERFENFYYVLTAKTLPPGIRAKADGLYQRFMLGLRSLSSPTDLIMIFFTSVLIWLLETVKYWFVMHAFDFSVGFLVLMLMNGLVNLATTLPSAPGYIGTFDTPGINTLVTFGVDRAIATSYTFTLHAALWVPVTLLGGYYFWRAHLRLSDIQAARAQVDAEAPPEDALGPQSLVHPGSQPAVQNEARAETS